MNITYKYKLSMSLTDAAATNDVNAATGYGAGGPFAHAVAGISAAGAVTAIAAGHAVGVIPTTNCSFDGRMEISKVYDIVFKDAVIVANQPHIYKLPISLLGIDDNQMINSIEFINTFNVIDKCLYPVTDRFFWKYDYDGEAIFFGFPHADSGSYAANFGLKMKITLVSKTL